MSMLSCATIESRGAVGAGEPVEPAGPLLARVPDEQQRPLGLGGAPRRGLRDLQQAHGSGPVVVRPVHDRVHPRGVLLAETVHDRLDPRRFCRRRLARHVVGAARADHGVVRAQAVVIHREVRCRSHRCARRGPRTVREGPGPSLPARPPHWWRAAPFRRTSPRPEAPGPSRRDVRHRAACRRSSRRHRRDEEHPRLRRPRRRVGRLLDLHFRAAQVVRELRQQGINPVIPIPAMSPRRP